MATACAERRSGSTWPCRSTRRNRAPAPIGAAALQPSTAATGYVEPVPKGMPTLRPWPSWSVLERRSLTTRPSAYSARSSTSRATSSERRKAPAKPSSSSARSRIRSKPSGNEATIAHTVAVSAGALVGQLSTEQVVDVAGDLLGGGGVDDGVAGGFGGPGEGSSHPVSHGGQAPANDASRRRVLGDGVQLAGEGVLRGDELVRAVAAAVGHGDDGLSSGQVFGVFQDQDEVVDFAGGFFLLSGVQVVRPRRDVGGGLDQLLVGLVLEDVVGNLAVGHELVDGKAWQDGTDSAAIVDVLLDGGEDACVAAEILRDLGMESLAGVGDETGTPTRGHLGIHTAEDVGQRSGDGAVVRVGVTGGEDGPQLGDGARPAFGSAVVALGILVVGQELPGYPVGVERQALWWRVRVYVSGEGPESRGVEAGGGCWGPYQAETASPGTRVPF